MPAWIEYDGAASQSSTDSGKSTKPYGHGTFTPPPPCYDSTKIVKDNNSSGGSSEDGLETGMKGEGDGEGMSRCLTTLDVVSLGVGSCCGSGMYLTAGIVASALAGPSGCISFVLAGLASLLTGMHFAELSALFPDTSGSAYVYAYLTLGELAAFTIGWALVVEYMIGTAAAAVALSETVDSVLGGAISGYIAENFTIYSTLDPVAAIVCLILTAVLASGVELSAMVNNILNLVCLLVWVTFIIGSIIFGDVENWSRGEGASGFFPFGFGGVVNAVPTAYFAFIGFDGLASTGGECKTPAKSIPRGIYISILINIGVFVSVVLGLTADIEYSKIPQDTGVVDVFNLLNQPVLRYIMAVGAVCGLFAATFGSLFPLPRVIQAMAQDGLIFRYFSHIHPTRRTAMRATFFFGITSAVLAAVVDLDLLMDLVLMGTLLGYIIVIFATIFIRYVDAAYSDLGSPRTSSILEDEEDDYDVFQENDKEFQYVSRHSHATPTHRHRSDSKLRTSDSESGDEERYDKNLPAKTQHHLLPARIQHQLLPESNRPRSRSATDKSDTPRDSLITTAATSYSTHSIVSDKGKFHDNHHHSNAYQLAKYSDSPLNPQRALGESMRSLPSCGDSASPVLVPLLSYVYTLACFMCNFRNIRDSLKLLIFYSRRQIIGLMLFIMGSLFVTVLIVGNFSGSVFSGSPVITAVFVVAATASLVSSILLIFQPQVKFNRGLKSTLRPLVSILAAFINLYLMASLSATVWGLFVAWMAIGFSIYYIYGIRSCFGLIKKDVTIEDDEKSNDLDNVKQQTLTLYNEKSQLISSN